MSGIGRELVDRWRAAALETPVAGEIETIYADLAAQIEARSPACWASGRCCNFKEAGHELFTTGLEAAYTLARAGTPAKPLEEGLCPYQLDRLCSAHTSRPLGCRVYFCDRSAQAWQQRLSEHGLAQIRALHQRLEIPYRYARWGELLTAFGVP